MQSRRRNAIFRENEIRFERARRISCMTLDQLNIERAILTLPPEYRINFIIGGALSYPVENSRFRFSFRRASLLFR